MRSTDIKQALSIELKIITGEKDRMNKTLPFTSEQAREWQKQFPTPFYVYDEAGIRETVRKLYAAFSWNEGFREYFAVKALPTPAVLRILEDMGCGADCSSVPEIMLAKGSRISGKRIMFTSNETTPAEYRAAREAGAIINLDDITQIENLENACGIPETVCCRYNPGEFRFADNAIMGHMYDTKFGMTKEQLFTSLGTLREKGASRFGIHAMLASCSLEQGYYPALARELFGLALEIRETLGITLSFVDMAGGIGIPYRPEQEPIDISEAGEGVRRVYEEMLRSNGIELPLFTEMGRYITGPHGYLLTTVVGKKHIWKEYVGVDASPADLIRPAMYGAYHHITVSGKEEAPADETVDVVGALCENNDKFAVDRPLPHTEIGDLLVIHDAGAHGRSMGYNYNGRLRCAEYLLKTDGTLQMVRRAETAADYFATFDIDPEFNY